MHRSSIEIAAMPEKVFAYLTEPQHLQSWQPDVAEPPTLSEEIRVGTRWTTKIAEYGRQFTVEMLVVAIAPNEQMVYEMQAPTASVHGEWRLSQHGDHTCVELTTIVKPLGFMRLVWPFVQGLFQRKMEWRLKLLRDAVEAGR